MQQCIFQLQSSGVATKSLIDEDLHSLQDAGNNEPMQKYMSCDHSKINYTCKFKLGGVTHNHDVNDVKSSVGQLLALLNMDSKQIYLFCYFPYQYWEKYLYAHDEM